MTNKARAMLEQCQNADERYLLVHMMADDGAVKKRYVGNEHNGFYVLDFRHNGESYTYKTYSRPDGTGSWMCVRIEHHPNSCQCYRCLP